MSLVVIMIYPSLLRIALGVSAEGVVSLSRPKSCLLMATSLMRSRRYDVVYEPLQAPDIIPTDEVGLGIQVGHEGVRLNLKDQYGPLARWRVNLRERYSYLMLLQSGCFQG